MVCALLFFCAKAAYGITPNFGVTVGGQVNTDGAYLVGVDASYHFGGTGRHASIDNVSGTGKGLYTPFPRHSLLDPFHVITGSTVAGGGGS